MKKLILIYVIFFNVISEGITQNRSLDRANQAVYNSISVNKSNTSTIKYGGDSNINFVNVNVSSSKISYNDIRLFDMVINWDTNSVQLKPNQGIRNNPSMTIQRRSTFINLNQKYYDNLFKKAFKR